MPFHLCCNITETENIAQDQFSIVFDSIKLADCVKAGQFLHIACGDALTLRRPISVCDTDKSLVKVVFTVKGAGTRWLSLRKPGDMLDILGPLGNGFDMIGEKLLLIGGGVGVPPLLLAARQATLLSKSRSSTALLGFAGIGRAILLGDFAAACASVEIATDDGSLGRHGFVTDLLKYRLNTGGFDQILACGPYNMLKIVSTIADENDIPCQVSMEERMGCGIGACLTCSCKTKSADNEEYSRVCVDGPVFSSREVVWNEA